MDHVPFGELTGDLSVFPADWRPQMLAQHPSPGRFTWHEARQFYDPEGQPLHQVRAAIEGDGLHLLTSRGWIAVPFDQLPDDLSAFPKEWREKITAGQKEPRKSGRHPHEARILTCVHETDFSQFK